MAAAYALAVGVALLLGIQLGHASPGDLVTPQANTGVVTLVASDRSSFAVDPVGSFPLSSQTPGAELVQVGARVTVGVVRVKDGVDVVAWVRPAAQP